MNEESEKSTEDCIYFLYAECLKGEDCHYRHCLDSLGTTELCPIWRRKGFCVNVTCPRRHINLTKRRSQLPCYFENKPGGCLKLVCGFKHYRERPGDPNWDPNPIDDYPGYDHPDYQDIMLKPSINPKPLLPRNPVHIAKPRYQTIKVDRPKVISLRKNKPEDSPNVIKEDDKLAQALRLVQQAKNLMTESTTNNSIPRNKEANNDGEEVKSLEQILREKAIASMMKKMKEKTDTPSQSPKAHDTGNLSEMQPSEDDGDDRSDEIEQEEDDNREESEEEDEHEEENEDQRTVQARRIVVSQPAECQMRKVKRKTDQRRIQPKGDVRAVKSRIGVAAVINDVIGAHPDSSNSEQKSVVLSTHPGDRSTPPLPNIKIKTRNIQTHNQPAGEQKEQTSPGNNDPTDTLRRRILQKDSQEVPFEQQKEKPALSGLEEERKMLENLKKQVMKERVARPNFNSLRRHVQAKSEARPEVKAQTKNETGGEVKRLRLTRVTSEPLLYRPPGAKLEEEKTASKPVSVTTHNEITSSRDTVASTGNNTTRREEDNWEVLSFAEIKARKAQRTKTKLGGESAPNAPTASEPTNCEPPRDTVVHDSQRNRVTLKRKGPFSPVIPPAPGITSTVRIAAVPPSPILPPCSDGSMSSAPVDSQRPSAKSRLTRPVTSQPVKSRLGADKTAQMPTVKTKVTPNLDVQKAPVRKGAVLEYADLATFEASPPRPLQRMKRPPNTPVEKANNKQLRLSRDEIEVESTQDKTCNDDSEDKEVNVQPIADASNQVEDNDKGALVTPDPMECNDKERPSILNQLVDKAMEADDLDKEINDLLGEDSDYAKYQDIAINNDDDDALLEELDGFL